MGYPICLTDIFGIHYKKTTRKKKQKWCHQHNASKIEDAVMTLE